jgi:hypothetical protein
MAAYITGGTLSIKLASDGDDYVLFKPLAGSIRPFAMEVDGNPVKFVQSDVSLLFFSNLLGMEQAPGPASGCAER